MRRSLKTLREKNDVRGVLGVLETCIRTNFAGVESARYVERHRPSNFSSHAIPTDFTVRLVVMASSGLSVHICDDPLDIL